MQTFGLRAVRATPRHPCDIMAIYHLSVKTISRSAGRTATAAAAYRAGVRITDERTGEIHDYGRKRGIESATLIVPDNAPEWARDRHLLWNAAEQAERRRNSTVAREFEIALPAELSPEGRAELAHDFARRIVKTHRCAADVCIHAPSRGGDQRNYHAHILLTTRRLGPDGLAEKTREMDDKTTGPELVKLWRETFAVLQNAWLQRAGLASRVDHRTLEAQRIERPATRHLGPAATGFERRTGRLSHRRVIETAVNARQCAQMARRGRELASEGYSLAVDEKGLQRAVLDAQEAFAAEQERKAFEEKALRDARERQRQARMNSQELAAEIARLKPKTAFELSWDDPAYRSAQEDAWGLQQKYRSAGRARDEAERKERAWRRDHPHRARLHDAGIWRSEELTDLVERQEERQARLDAIEPPMRRAEYEAERLRKQAEMRIEVEQWPVRRSIERLEELRKEKVQEERAQARREYKRDKTVQDFKVLAVKREGRSLGYRDGQSKWEATPPALRALVDRFNELPKAGRASFLERLRGNDEKCQALSGLMQERERVLDQDRGLSM